MPEMPVLPVSEKPVLNNRIVSDQLSYLIILLGATSDMTHCQSVLGNQDNCSFKDKPKKLKLGDCKDIENESVF